MPKQFIIFVAIIQGIIFLAHFVVYKTIVSVFDVHSLGLMIAFIILSVVFTMSAVFINMMPSRIGSALYIVASVWVGMLVWLLLGCIPMIFFPEYAHAILITIFLFHLSGLFNSNYIRVTTYRVKIKNLPHAWLTKKVVMLADVHLGAVNGHRFAKKVADKIHSLKPDIVFIVGDLFDGPPTDFEKAVEPFSHFNAYFVMGNHEEYRDREQYIAPIKKAGITILNNEKIHIDGMDIVGLDFMDSQTAEKQKHLLSHIHTANPTILLKHVPLQLEQASEKGIALQLSGHTHQGQMWPFSILTHFVYRGYDYGLKRYKNMQVITTSGVGTWGPLQRIGTRSEIVNIIFENDIII